ncbi:hypothetical protein E2F50_20215 [Rhizobium deserti]|uniref:Uncharacterized protein n=1 Tax=Rhizobium deserti TaxID=2547961 RepID=A0A4V3ANH4_9HYPH|nr:hypothetical protein [Rhizobium deserti]TDK31268.1 hypothetical protein E2F50_20215 [Rhizobium deserti]
MAETEFILSLDRLLDFIKEHLLGCLIAKDGPQPVSRAPDNELLSELSLQSQQLFIKHPVFAADDFIFKPHKYAENEQVFRVDQFTGAGHLKMLTLPLPGLTSQMFRVAVSYQSFFVLREAHISPSTELRKFYTSSVATAKRGTRRLELSPGRGMWFQQELLNRHPDLLGTVRASFRRS